MCATHPIVPNRYRGTTTYHKVFCRLIQAALARQPIHYGEIAAIMNLQGTGQHMSLITLYIDDPDYLYCFQPEHACLALPLKRAILTKRDLLDEGIRPGFNKNQTRLLHTLLRLKCTALSTVVGLVSSGPT